MVTLKLSDEEEVRQFNLKSFEREQALYKVYKDFKDTEEAKIKRINLTTAENEQLSFLVEEIIYIDQEDVEYVIAEECTEEELNFNR